MQVPDVSSRKSMFGMSVLRSFLTLAIFLSWFVVFSSKPGHAIPAFARKYGLPCCFSRVGAYGWWFLKDLDIETLYMHGQDNVYLRNGVAANNPGSLPPGAAGPSWNGGFVEAHYTYSPQLIFTGRYELVHMSRQANAALAATPNLGSVDSWTIGYRWYPIMFSRAGLAFHNEYTQAKTGNTSLLTGSDQTSRSVIVGFDFDY